MKTDVEFQEFARGFCLKLWWGETPEWQSLNEVRKCGWKILFQLSLISVLVSRHWYGSHVRYAIPGVQAVEAAGSWTIHAKEGAKELEAAPL